MAELHHVNREQTKSFGPRHRQGVALFKTPPMVERAYFSLSRYCLSPSLIRQMSPSDSEKHLASFLCWLLQVLSFDLQAHIGYAHDPLFPINAIAREKAERRN